jgi:porin
MFETGAAPESEGSGEGRGNSFFYGIIDQWLFLEPGGTSDDPQGLACFGRAFFTGSPDQSPLSFLFNAGFTYTGLVPGRDQDAAGIALCLDQLTPGASQDLAGKAPGLEVVLEATYQAQITPWFSIQPDLQFIIQPGGNGAIPNAFVLGLAASIDF